MTASRLISLPAELLQLVFRNLDVRVAVRLSVTCQTLYKAIQSDRLLWAGFALELLDANGLSAASWAPRSHSTISDLDTPSIRKLVTRPFRFVHDVRSADSNQVRRSLSSSITFGVDPHSQGVDDDKSEGSDTSPFQLNEMTGFHLCPGGRWVVSIARGEQELWYLLLWDLEGVRSHIDNGNADQGERGPLPFSQVHQLGVDEESEPSIRNVQRDGGNIHVFITTRDAGAELEKIWILKLAPGPDATTYHISLAAEREFRCSIPLLDGEGIEDDTKCNIYGEFVVISWLHRVEVWNWVHKTSAVWVLGAKANIAALPLISGPYLVTLVCVVDNNAEEDGETTLEAEDFSEGDVVLHLAYLPQWNFCQGNSPHFELLTSKSFPCTSIIPDPTAWTPTMLVSAISTPTANPEIRDSLAVVYLLHDYSASQRNEGILTIFADTPPILSCDQELCSPKEAQLFRYERFLSSARLSSSPLDFVAWSEHAYSWGETGVRQAFKSMRRNGDQPTIDTSIATLGLIQISSTWKLRLCLISGAILFTFVDTNEAYFVQFD